MKRLAWILLVAGIVGILVFLATRADRPARIEPAAGPGGEPEATRRESRIEPLGAEAPSSERAEVALPDGAPAELAERAGWRVCVVDGRTNAAVAGATVSVLELRTIGRELSDRGIGFDTLEGLRVRRERCVEALTGADGCVQFPAPPESAMVEARFGVDWAIATVNKLPDDRCVTLKLAQDRDLRVRVVDALGAGIGGVPVALRGHRRQELTFKWTDTQAGTGLATFLHFQRRLEQGSGWQAVFAFPLRNEPAAAVDANTPLEPPITLVLPDTGRMRIRVRTPDGLVPDLEGIDLQLDAFPSESGGLRLWPDGPWARPRLDAAGEALVPWIGLDLHVKAILILEEAEKAARTFAGPASPGEETLCELVLSRPPPAVVTGRFVLRDGRAWPAATVEVAAALFPTPARPSPVREVRVDEGGRFRMPVHELRPANGTRAFHFSAPHPDGAGRVVAIVALDQDIPPEGLELGDVVLDFGELLVSGRVVDQERRAIEGAFVFLHSRAVASGQEYWPGLQTAGTVRTAEDGVFALYSPPGVPAPSEVLRLSAHAAGFGREGDRDVRRGERDVEVVLTQGGALAGSLVLDGDTRLDEVSLFLRWGKKLQNVPVRSDATFEALELSPGTYSLVARLGVENRLERESAALVEGLLIRAGETCRDPRIQGLRIGSGLTTLKIRVVDRALTPLRGAAVSIVGTGDANTAISKADGVCVVRSKVLPVDLEVSAFGYQRQRLANVSADQEVVLETGFPIRLHTDAKPSGGQPKYMLGAMLFSIDAAGLRRGPAWGREFTSEYASGRSHFDEHGELALRMPAAGQYECEVHVTVLSDGVGRGAIVELSSPARITVLASSAEQVFELAIPQQAVDQAIERALQ